MHVAAGLAGPGEGDGLAPAPVQLLAEQGSDLGVGAVLADPLLDDPGEFSGEVVEGLVEHGCKPVEHGVKTVESDGDDGADFLAGLLGADLVGDGEVAGEDLDGLPLRAAGPPDDEGREGLQEFFF